MNRQLYPLVVVIVGAWMALAILTPLSASGQTQRAMVVTIEGATQKWRVIDKHGHEVEVDIPSQAPIDIRTGQAAQMHADSTAASGSGRVQATVVAVDTTTNRVKMQTPQGQILELETPANNMRIGDKVMLVVP
jgi:hypothetical protein